MSPSDKDEVTAEPVRERIVNAFTDRARMHGPRSVVMAELARDLGISTRTLYRHFRSKNDLMIEVMTRFADETALAQQSRIDRRLSPVDRLRETAIMWVETQIRFSTTFWDEVQQQHPDAMALWHDRLKGLWAQAHERMVPSLRDDLPPRLAVSLMMSGVLHASDPARCDRLGISRQEAVIHAVNLWARGALKRPTLTVVETVDESVDESGDDPQGT